jgi:hypothetical protein
MKTNPTPGLSIKRVFRFLGNVVKALVKGFPSRSLFLRPEKSSEHFNRSEAPKSVRDKVPHQPLTKLTVERQTFVKERKKMHAAN